MGDLPKVSSRCEVITNIDAVQDKRDRMFCGKRATHWYPTQNGTMALCIEHVQKHLRHDGAWAIGEPSPWSQP